MAYLPPGTIPVVGDAAQFPKATGNDLRRTIREIEEVWTRHYPLIEYRVLRREVTPATEQASNEVVGNVGATRIDPLWGEAVDPGLSTGAQWVQPHSRDGAKVASQNTEVHAPGVRIHTRVTRTALDKTLKKYGFDRIRGLIFTIPTSFLDARGIVSGAGDVLVWGSDQFTVIDQVPQGFFFNTNIPLYVVLNCEHRRQGS